MTKILNLEFPACPVDPLFKMLGPRPPLKWVEGRVAMNIFEGFGEALFMEFNEGQEPVSIVHYTRPGSSTKQSTPN